MRPEDITARAAAVLRENDMGTWTRASPTLYPHQWSWDSAFIAIGLAHLDTVRAAGEIRSLLDHQWENGKIPHIIFNPEAPPESYFPGPEHWASAAAAPDIPAMTSGLCQPPVHAFAALRILQIAEARGEGAAGAREFLAEVYPKLLAWHRYLATARDPEGSGLVTIYHPWESGTDNSPRWTGALERVEVGKTPDYERADLEHVEPSERPTGYEYDRFIWLVDVIKGANCDDAVLYRECPFLAKDVLASAILVRANEALLEIAEIADAPEKDRSTVRTWIERGRKGIEERWNPDLSLCSDYDLRAERPLSARTIAGFAPLIAGGGRSDHLGDLLRIFDSRAFAGNPDLRWPLPPSTSPGESGFQPRSYWRGPVWPVINWLLWWSLERSGEKKRAARLKGYSLAQLLDGCFGEYYEPFTGEALGSDYQSWTAAVALDWMAHEEVAEKP
ncbi:GH63 [uncultured Rubrobacteraceae bacterium]|uniref:GH63 n=1 Tax=uncultured Rubrobacteraceae bacterium TaxID=349277 RepID=A0A6J4PCC8_9ACTN|nr:GH63 [uncultured Rubrobacteraceae bacterium]